MVPERAGAPATIYMAMANAVGFLEEIMAGDEGGCVHLQPLGSKVLIAQREAAPTPGF